MIIVTPASQGSLTQNCHEKIKQNSHTIIILVGVG